MVCTDVYISFTSRIGLLQASQSPLSVAVAAGSVALPQLLKLSKVSKNSLSLSGNTVIDLATCEQMPIELELGPEFNFHSIFACPVSKEQTDKNNPPKLLPCGHVLSSQSIDNIANQSLYSLKCPYCPQECSPALCRPLLFPDVGMFS
jgi:E3 ubiquitin-protein transferase RMND5